MSILVVGSVAFDSVETHTSQKKQFLMLRIIMEFYRYAREAFQKGADVLAMDKLPVLEAVSRAKLISEEELARFDEILEKAREETAGLAPAEEPVTENESAT